MTNKPMTYSDIIKKYFPNDDPSPDAIVRPVESVITKEDMERSAQEISKRKDEIGHKGGYTGDKKPYVIDPNHHCSLYPATARIYPNEALGGLTEPDAQTRHAVSIVTVKLADSGEIARAIKWLNEQQANER